jgi:glycine cleavage system H protein
MMSKILDADNTRYTKDHVWVMLEDDVATIGVTDFALRELPEINFVEMPAEGLEVNAGDEVAAIEANRDSVAVVAPVDGTVSEINLLLEENPGLLHSDPYGDGWLLRVEMSDPATWQDLLTAEEYEEYIGG